ncbi:MAG: DUF2330 domain-containing protein [Deltaproteobacteria bacterium]|nr:DUF2330 domain-containing protein [Deltaproteobacteria bacterium]
MSRIGITLGAAALALAGTAGSADAFCGFYVEGSGAKLAADATQVVLMRDGTRTVLSMQNDYKGPLNDFAMVIPVPVVLKEADVKTLSKDVLNRIESLGAPRLVEYWEQDPCPKPQEERAYDSVAKSSMAPMAGAGRMETDDFKDTVKIEAKFDVAEYKILILSATEATGLERWLKANGYQIPAGAEPLLRPYVEGGSKFFVAKVDPKKVQMVDGRAQLSPIRFHYESEEFALPIRLGMANSTGKQDLIVNILAKSRYEVANYKNVVIPTNFDVKDSVRTRFAEFYAALYDKTMEANPGSVVTEYAWTSQPYSMCDPCPPEIPTTQDAATLGGDIVGGEIAQGNYVLTRLHARYGKADMKDDLRFREAKPITGGRETWSKQGLEYGASPASTNAFQARYAIRHWWTGPMKCAKPRRGVWGGPPDGRHRNTIAASKLAYAPRGKLALGTVIKRDLWEIGYKKAAAKPAPPSGGAKFATPPGTKAMGFGMGAIGGMVLLGLGMLMMRRKQS